MVIRMIFKATWLRVGFVVAVDYDLALGFLGACSHHHKVLKVASRVFRTVTVWERTDCL